MVIFHSYVSLPEGNSQNGQYCRWKPEATSKWPPVPTQAIRADGAPKIAELTYKWFTYGLW